ncbi:tyrosine-type recombinase/integrase [Pseudomonas aeruginosa]|uniref:tyrosine-type recombinase/integrase n=1 Tax=Pseudomonas aeruginosa TaxID=287 RepID=UPI000EABE296|nr:site-specific integrase [Pseudomonas aeruginosa]HBO2745116.1 site-specific integrase [Pseudomonas aeruginosa]
MKTIQAVTNIRPLTTKEKQGIAVSFVTTPTGEILPVSFYYDDVWDFSSVIPHATKQWWDTKIRWDSAPSEWRESLRECIAASMVHAPEGGLTLSPSVLPKAYVYLNSFAKWCSSLGLKNPGEVTPFHMATYLNKLTADGIQNRSISTYLNIIRRLYTLREHITTPLPKITSEAILPIPAISNEDARLRRTKIIPLSEAKSLFQAALELIDNAHSDIDLKEEIDKSWLKHRGKKAKAEWNKTIRASLLKQHGFSDIKEFRSRIVDIRTSCYIILALTTGCRVHELGDIRVGCVYSQNISGKNFWWLKSWTRKIFDKPTRWLTSPISKKVSIVLERLSEGERRRIKERISLLKEQLDSQRDNSTKAKVILEILKLRRNQDRLFLTASGETIDSKTHNKQLNAFARRIGINSTSELSTHRFRRTYAALIVNLDKGSGIDIFTLKIHFHHASIENTEWYATLDNADRKLLELINEERDEFDFEVASHWLDLDTPLTGGFGSRIKEWTANSHLPMFFKDHREMVLSLTEGMHLRSTGHSWSLSGMTGCGGKGLFEPSTCGQCNEAVIDDSHWPAWIAIRDQQLELIDREDIGPGGRIKAQAALSKSNDILAKLIHPRLT